jgi:DNA-binding CsgD family transcriptional regulator
MRGVRLHAARGRGPLLFQSEAPVLPALIARELEDLERRGRLEGRWHVRLSSSLEAEPLYALEPQEGSATEAELEGDLLLLGESLGPRLQEAIAEELGAEALDGASALTQRETEVLLAFVDGHAVKTMARRLHVSPHTIRNHLKAIFQKLGVHSQKELRELFTAGRLDDSAG